MKINMWKLLIVASFVSIATGACTDERDNFMVDDTIGLVKNNQVIDVSIYEGQYQFAVIKSGKGQQSATVNLTVSETALAEYNTANGTDYTLMPESCYAISSSAINFTKSEIRKFIDITWNNTAIFALDGSKEYVIPLQVSVSNDAVAVDANRSLAIVYPKRASISMGAPLAEAMSPVASRAVITRQGAIALSYALEMDITINYAIDNSLIAAYNAANGTDYKAAPEGLVTLAAASSVIAAGQQSATFSCQLNSQSLFTGNVLNSVDENKYLAPVRITSISVDGVNITDDNIMYVPIVMEMNRTLKGPWTMLEGMDNCYARDPKAPGWASGYTADKLFDGEVTQGHEWISQFDTPTAAAPIPFPMTFVVDMGDVHVFTQFITADYSTHSGQYRDFKFYTAETYNGASTDWKLACEAHTDFSWSAEVKYYTTPANTMVAGRYLKVEILKACWALDHPDYLGGRGKMADIQGVGF